MSPTQALESPVLRTPSQQGHDVIAGSEHVLMTAAGVRIYFSENWQVLEVSQEHTMAAYTHGPATSVTILQAKTQSCAPN